MARSTSAVALTVERPRWTLQLCGLPRLISASAHSVTLERRDAAMLALLAIEGPMARRRVMALLWPDEAQEQIRGRLRQRIYALRRKLGLEAITGSLTLARTPALAWPGFDGEPLDGALLGDDDYVDLPEFAQWLEAMRDRLHCLRRERLASEASSLELQGRLAEAIACSERLLAQSPLQEHAHRRLMRLHYLRGDRSAALLAFDRCEKMLKDDVGATPSTETLELLAQIERSQPLAVPGPRRVVPASVLRPPRLIGRDAEWVLLQAAWERGDAVVVVGEAGMGKTRLVDDLLRTRTTAPGQALQASARPGDERVPDALLGRLLRGLLAARTEALPEGVESELARLLPELPQRKGAAVGNDAGARARFVGAIEATLRDAVSSGLETVALDDLHFADAASLEMTQHLAGTPGLRWLAAFRGAEIGPAAKALVETLTTRLHAEPIVLQPLTSEHVAELIDSLGLGALNELDVTALVGALHRHTGGNPLFLLETLKALLLQEGAAERADVAAVQALTRLPHSGGAVRLIERRIGSLSRDAVRLARCAAIAGQDFSAGLAARVLDVNPLDLADAWTELESAQVLRDGAFAHDLIFEAARASVPEPIARVLHRRIAELMVAEGGATPARLAAHWLGAGEDLRAAPHLADAGRLALRALRLPEGIEYLDRAQSIHGRAGDADTQCSLIAELISPAVMASSFDYIERMVDLAARNASTDRQRSMTLRSLASLLSQRCDYVRASEICRQALEAAMSARDRACELAARALLAEVLGLLGRGAEAEAMLRPIEAWVDDHGRGEHRLVYADAMAKVLQDGGKLAEALDEWNKAIDMARASGAEHALPDLLMQRATTLALAGRISEGRAALVEGRQLLRDIPEDAMGLRPFTIRLQVIDRQLGRYTSSLALGEQVLADPATGPSEVDEVQLAQAFAFCDLGQPARVRQLLSKPRVAGNAFMDMFWNEAEAQLPVSAPPHHEARRRALDAAAAATSRLSRRALLPAWRIQARHGEDVEASAAALKGMEFTLAGGMHGPQLVFQAMLAQRLYRLGDTAQAVWLARDSWRLMAEFETGLVYRGVIWQALIEVLEPHDAALARTIAHSAADWIFHTAAEHVPPAFRESFLHRNTFNAFVLAKVRGT